MDLGVDSLDAVKLVANLEHAPHACIHMCILMCMACAWHVQVLAALEARRAAEAAAMAIQSRFRGNRVRTILERWVMAMAPTDGPAARAPTELLPPEGEAEA